MNALPKARMLAFAVPPLLAVGVSALAFHAFFTPTGDADADGMTTMGAAALYLFGAAVSVLSAIWAPQPDRKRSRLWPGSPPRLKRRSALGPKLWQRHAGG